MTRGTTPTVTFTFPEDLDLEAASGVYVTFRYPGGQLTKQTEDLTVDKNSVHVFLSQEETLAITAGEAKVQVNWTFHDESGETKRACSNIATLAVDGNLLNRVVP